MTMMPDVAGIADIADAMTSKEEILEQAAKEEWCHGTQQCLLTICNAARVDGIFIATQTSQADNTQNQIGHGPASNHHAPRWL